MCPSGSLKGALNLRFERRPDAAGRTATDGRNLGAAGDQGKPDRSSPSLGGAVTIWRVVWCYERAER